ncbi:AAA family ATPase [Longispora sp. NPDC051575]|uniref:helix-turn-helix transcriptional regulator n=1 Tax=Longispora sp. NPDC051575 TaxID=3154943 RepID=UPI00342A7B84
MRLISSVLVGRNAELHRLTEALTVARGGAGQAALVVGEAGIGKSRLIGELQRLAGADGVLVCHGRTSTTAPSVPFRPLAEAVLTLVRAVGVPDQPDLAPYRAALGRLIPEWREEGDARRGESVLVLAESILRLLAVASRDTGCLMVLEDLHDADPETLAVVEYLIDNLDRLPVLLIGTSRPEVGPARELAESALRRRMAQVIELGALDDQAVSQLIAHCLESAQETVPPVVTSQVRRDGDGNPFVVEELLAGLVGAGHLVRRARVWTVDGSVTTKVPTTVVVSVTERAERLGEAGHALLRSAATLGRRFSVEVVQRATGVDVGVLRQVLSTAVRTQLIVPDDHGPEWYAFRHALTADALLAPLLPSERAVLAGQLATAIETLFPTLDGEWCQHLAQLKLATGDEPAAASLFTEAGRRALADGAPTSAVTLLEKARKLSFGWFSPALRAETLEPLLSALTESGQTERALEMEKDLEVLAGHLDGARLAALHTRMAEAAAVAGRWRDGLAQVAVARRLLGPDAAPGRTAPIDVIEARILQDVPDDPRVGEAEGLARRALDDALRFPLPEVGCQALEVLGIAARRRSMAESEEVFQRMVSLADEHNLPVWRVTALSYLGVNDMLTHGAPGRLHQAREESARIGALPTVCNVDGLLAWLSVHHGDYEGSRRIADPCEELAGRLRLRQIGRYLSLVNAVSAAHRGRKEEMDEHLVALVSAGGEDTHYLPVAWGLAEGVYALLEEDRAGSRAKLDQARERENRYPSAYTLSGTFGLALLLEAMDGDAGWSEHAAIAASMPGQVRWNQQFVVAARAVLHARDGDKISAELAVAESQEIGEPFPLGRALVLRLVAESALDDDWGQPAAWARAAAEHFQRAGLGTAAAACRALLRRAGASVPQQRKGWETVPAPLRESGVTVREFEVLVLLAERLGNVEIGQRLFISARTVEKHVASLLGKLGHSDRLALCDFAAGMAF